MKFALDTTVAGIALLAFSVSCVFSFFVLPQVVGLHNVNLDPDEYGVLAGNLYAGNGIRYGAQGPLAVDRGPVYPYLVAALFVVSGGYAVWIVQLFQAALHAATTVAVFLLAARLFGRRRGLWAQLACALHPILLWYTGRIWIETTYAFMLVLLAGTIVTLYARPTALQAVKSGALLGVTTLTKSVTLLFPLVLMFMLWRKHKQPGLMYGAIVLVVCGVVIGPWMVRNYSVSNAFVPVHTSLGFNLIQGDVIAEQWPTRWCCNLDFWHVGQARADSLLQARGLSSWRDAEGDRLLVYAALRRYTEQPDFVVRRIAANFFTFWSLSESPLKSLLFGALQWILVLAAVAACFRSGKDNRLMVPLVALTIYYIAVHAGLVGWARYSMPIIPLLLVVAAGFGGRIGAGSTRAGHGQAPSIAQR